MSNSSPVKSSTPLQAADKPNRDAVKADREAAKEAKRALKAAAQAKKGVPTSAAGSVSIDSTSSSKKPSQQSTSAVGKKASGGAERPSGSASGASTKVEPKESGDGAQQRSSASSSKVKATLDSTVISTTPSVLGGASLFGNVSTSTHSDEISQYVVAASYRSLIHPSVLKLAQHLASFTIVGADARAIAVLKALRDFVIDYRTPSGAVFSRDLVTKLGPQIGFLVHSRPLGASVGHAIRYLKYEISVTPVELTEEEVSDTSID
jgi:translation initiation factor eIF-2B subunit delta